MAAQSLAALSAGASLLALAQPAFAQAHAGHTTPTPADPHADHAMMPAPTPQTAPQPLSPKPDVPGMDHSMQDMSSMEGMNHGDQPMTSALGPWPLSRDASGTSWQPDVSEHAGIHTMRGDWSFMTHALLNLTYDGQNGPRGDKQTFVSGMLMTSARRAFDDGSTMNLRAMVSPDPLMGKRGYPLLLAAGETADGIQTLVDRQHPHDLFMELSASYARRLSDTDSVFGYIGLPGEPAFGPPAFMHRMSTMDSPEAPITHHWLDSTHIVFGVATLGWVHDAFKLEASTFKGREPNQHRYDIERPEFDSWSVRASWNPSPEWSLQASYADVTSPEQLSPDDDDTKWSASAIHTRRIGTEGWWSTTLAWGTKAHGGDDATNALAFESAFSPNARWTVFARAERTETDELLELPGGAHGPVYTVGKVSIGAIRDWRVAEHVTFGLGALYASNFVPNDLEPDYAGDPDGGMIFMRLKID
ncbi:hypothetical protein BZG35_11120 [Brevundimonas sp. LM2]|uniref:hypothetical protein n=1 Tax=Brevundimonas sp. LM2 TaxID=1938605 RepID=UPI000983B535|nr:hypothetical protein [Brevundimonas sp. LM2]AQR62133.1 hypothetical protein BZG35_11120 [Brevundimonas sp. LM2]